MLRPRYIETPYKQIPAPLQKEEAIAISKPHQKKRKKKERHNAAVTRTLMTKLMVKKNKSQIAPFYNK
jgi:hypothetical protein